MGVTATVTDGGTLSYSWDLYKFALIDQGGKSVPGARRVFSTFTGSGTLIPSPISTSYLLTTSSTLNAFLTPVKVLNPFTLILIL